VQNTISVDSGQGHDRRRLRDYEVQKVVGFVIPALSNEHGDTSDARSVLCDSPRPNNVTVRRETGGEQIGKLIGVHFHRRRKRQWISLKTRVLIVSGYETRLT
jgi:hypothetical protein